MNEKAYLEKLKELAKQDPSKQLSNAFAAAYREDSLATEEQLLARAKASLGSHEGLEAMATGKNASPLTQAFGVSEEGLRRVIDPNSSSNWMNMSSAELLKAGIKGGYIRNIPKDPSTAEREEQREQFGRFLKMLEKASTDQGRRNSVAAYENIQFTKDPIGWVQKGINDILFRTYSKRALEQALNGEGASSWGGMSLADVGTLGTDIAANAAYGAGAAGLSRAVAGNGLRTAGALYGSDAAAGVLGGAADVMNRSLNTRAGVMPYEYVTEPVVGGISNALMSPGAVRSMISGALNFMRGGHVGDLSRRNAMQRAGEWVASKTGWDEAELARTFMENGISPNQAGKWWSADTKKKVKEMKDIWDDGMGDNPGEKYSLFDELQALYEQLKGVPEELGAELEEGMTFTDVQPSAQMFDTYLKRYIDNLKGALENSAGAEEAPALKRKIKYMENARDLFANGLLDPHTALDQTDPVRMGFDFREPFTPGKARGEEFKVRPADEIRDMELMEDYVNNAVHGDALDVDEALADRLAALREAYPAFDRYVSGIRTVRLPGYESKMGSYRNGDVMYGNTVSYEGTPGNRAFVPTREVINAAFNPKVAGVKGAALQAGSTLSDAVLTGIARPVVTVESKKRFEHEDDSFEAVQRQYEELKSRKPVAAEAALNWKYDPKLDEKDQLNSEERNLVNKYRKMMQEEAMNGR